MTLKPDPDDPRRPLFPLHDTGSWSVPPIVVAGLALFAIALFVFSTGSSTQPKTTPLPATLPATTPQ
jgi:hypothetical protein